MSFLNVQGIQDYYNSILSTVDNDAVPSQVNDNVQPTIDINPLSNPTATIVKFSQNTAFPKTLYTTPASGQRFYLTYISMSAGASASNATIYIKATIGGTNSIIASMPTNASVGVSLLQNFAIPVIIDAGTNITFDGDNPVSSGDGVIAGFLFNPNITGLQAINY